MTTPVMLSIQSIATYLPADDTRRVRLSLVNGHQLTEDVTTLSDEHDDSTPHLSDGPARRTP